MNKYQTEVAKLNRTTDREIDAPITRRRTMPRPIEEIVAHIRAACDNLSVDATLIQTEDLYALCDGIEQLHETCIKQGETIDRLHDEIARLREALKIIAGRQQCLDNLMSNVDVACAALDGGKP